MRKFIKGTAVVFAGALACASLAACGNNPFGDDGDQRVEGKYNLVIACQDEDGEVQILQTLKEKYEAKNPNANIIIKDFGGDLFTNYMAKYATNQKELPDVIWMPDDQFAAFAKGGYFEDLRPFYEADASTDYGQYYESMLHTASYSGEFRPTTSYSGSYTSTLGTAEKSDGAEYGLYYAPRDYNKIGIVYNKEVFNRFKVAVPQQNADGTWNTESGRWDMAELIKLTKTLTAAIEAKGASFAGYRALSLFLQWEPVYTTVFKAMGSDGLVGDTDFLIDSAKNKEICDTLYNELFHSKIAIDRNGSFLNGTTAMDVVVRPVAYTYSLTLKNDDGSSKIDFLPFPAEDIGAGCSGYGILKTHANDEQTASDGVTKLTKEVAWDFIKFVISEEGQEATGALGFTQPILKSLEKTGAWTQAISPSLNHSAWVAGNELRLTLYNKFDPSKRTDLRNCVQGFFQNLSDQVEGAPDKREALITKYKDDFRNKV